jgi:hypothetical protein
MRAMRAVHSTRSVNRPTSNDEIEGALVAETVLLVREHMFGYTAGGFGLLAIVVALAFAPAFASRVALPASLRGSAAFFTAIAAAILAFRWPILWMNDAVQGDESALIVMARTALQHPIPWEKFDPSTSGPLNVLALAPVVALFSAHVYLGSRLFACALAVAGLYLLYRSGKELYGEFAGRVMALAPATFYCVVTSYDLTPYTSEAVANVLVATAGLLAIRIALSPADVARRALGAGLVLGLIPLSKLQALPIAGALFVLFALAIWKKPHAARAVGLLGLGAILPASIVTFVLLARGDAHNAFVSYVLQSSAYVGTPKDVAGYWWYALLLYPWTGPLFCGLIVAALLLRGAGGTALQRAAPFGAAFVALAALVAIAVPGYWSQHYLQLAVLPCSAAAGFALGRILVQAPALRPALGAAALYAFVTVVPLVVERALALDPASWSMSHPFSSRRSEVVEALLSVTHPGDTMSVWGFMPDYYIVSGASDATENAHTPFQILDGPNREYFRRRYLGELREAPPNLFVDAVGPDSFMFQDSQREGIASFPALAAFVNANYCLARRVRGSSIYVLRAPGSQACS